MKKITRKLKLLHQIYLFNIGKIADLENDNGFNKKFYLNNISKRTFYYNPKDLRLVISCLPMNQIDKLFEKVFLNLLATDKKLRLNSKILKQIATQLPAVDIEDIFLFANNNTVNTPDMCNVVMNYTVIEIISHLKWLYFKKNNTKLHKQTIARFKPFNHDINLESALHNIEIDIIVEQLFPEIMPYINEAIKSFNHGEVAL